MPNENVTEEWATPPNQWVGSRNGGFKLTLPSGNRAQVRRTLSLMTMLEHDEIPNPLAVHVRKMLGLVEGQPISEASSKGTLDFKEMDPRALEQLFQMVREQAVHIFVKPRVMLVPEGEDPHTWQPDVPNTLSVYDVDFNDLFFAYQFAQGGSASLLQFRQSQKTVAAMADVPEVPQPPSANSPG